MFGIYAHTYIHTYIHIVYSYSRNGWKRFTDQMLLVFKPYIRCNNYKWVSTLHVQICREKKLWKKIPTHWHSTIYFRCDDALLIFIFFYTNISSTVVVILLLPFILDLFCVLTGNGTKSTCTVMCAHDIFVLFDIKKC